MAIHLSGADEGELGEPVKIANRHSIYLSLLAALSS